MPHPPCAQVIEIDDDDDIELYIAGSSPRAARGGHAGGSRRSRDRTRSRGMLGWGLVWVAVGHKETQHKRALALAQADANDTTAVRDPSGCSAPHRAPRLKRAFRAQRAGSSEPASRSAAEADGTWRLRRLPPACPPRAARGLLPAI